MSALSGPIRAGAAWREHNGDPAGLASTRRLAIFGRPMQVVGEHLPPGPLSFSPLWDEETRRELSALIQEGLDEAGRLLGEAGFEPRPHDPDWWEDVARVVGKDPGPMTLAGIYDDARAWVARKRLEARYLAEAQARASGDHAAAQAQARSDAAALAREVIQEVEALLRQRSPAAGTGPGHPAAAEDKAAKRGRQRRTDWDEDAAIVEAWERARDEKVRKKDFAKERRLSRRQVDKILDRHRKRLRKK